MHTFSSYFPPPTECSLKISLSVLRIRFKFWFLTPDSFKTQLFQASDITLIFIHQPVLHILNGQEKLRCSLSQTTNADTSIFWLWANCTTYFYTNIFSRQDFLMFCSFSNLRWWRVIRVSSWVKKEPICFCSEYTGTDIVFAKSSSLVMPLIDVPCTVLSSDCNFL